MSRFCFIENSHFLFLYPRPTRLEKNIADSPPNFHSRFLYSRSFDFLFFSISFNKSS